MKIKKRTEIITMRVEPEFKELLRINAEVRNMSITEFIEKIILSELSIHV